MENSTDSQSSSSKKKENSADAAVADEDALQYSSADEDEDLETAGSSDGELSDDKENFDDTFDDEDETELDNNTPPVDDTLTYIRRLVVRTRSFIKLTRRCYLIHDYLKQKAVKQKLDGHGLILDCIIRWNSSFYMLNRIINYQDVINQTTINPRLISPSLAAYIIHRLKQFIFHYDTWEHLIAIRDVLSKFEEACRFISGKKYQTLSIGFLVLVGLEHHLSQPVKPGPQVAIELILKKSLYVAHRYHVDDKVTFEQRYSMMIACFLNPETYFRMNDNSNDEAQKHIIAEARKCNLSQQTVTHLHVPSNSNDNNSARRYATSNSNQINNFLTGCGLDPPTTSFTSVRSKRTIKEEIAYYINNVTTLILFEEFWVTHETELPCLAILVRSFNIRPVSSVASESLFSVAAYVNRKQCCSLSSDAIRYSMVLRDADVVASLL